MFFASSENVMHAVQIDFVRGFALCQFKRLRSVSIIRSMDDGILLLDRPFYALYVGDVSNFMTNIEIRKH